MNDKKIRYAVPVAFASFVYLLCSSAHLRAAPSEESARALFPAVFSASNSKTKKEFDLIGYIDQDGITRIAPSFDGVGEFHDGLARVNVDYKYGFIDRKGKLVIPATFDSANGFSDGCAAVFRRSDSIFSSSKWGFIDKTGKLIVDFKYDDVLDFHEGRAGVVVGSGFKAKAGYVDRHGRVVVPLQEDFHISDFSNGLALIDSGYGTVHNLRFIRPDGTLAFKGDQYHYVYEFRDGLALFIAKTSQYGFLDTKGQIAIPAAYDHADDFNEGMAAVRIDGKNGYIDAKGNIAVALTYDQAEPFHDGLGAVRAGDLWGFVDKNGKLQIKPDFVRFDWPNSGQPEDWPERASRPDAGSSEANYPPFFSEGYAMVASQSGWRGFINKRGEHVLTVSKDRRYGTFKNGLVAFQRVTPTDKDTEYEFGYSKIDGTVVYRYTVKGRALEK
jgi:hypothetical protein